MAKTAVINRDLKRRKIVKKFAKKRTELLAVIDNAKISDEDRFAARQKLQQLPRDSSPTRLRPGVRGVCSASSAWAATSCARSRCGEKFPAWSRRAGSPVQVR